MSSSHTRHLLATLHRELEHVMGRKPTPEEMQAEANKHGSLREAVAKLQAARHHFAEKDARMAAQGRIPEAIAALMSAWTAHPELRLGQLLAAAAGTDDPFFVEDTAWVERLRALAARRRSGDEPSLGGTDAAQALPPT